MNIQILENMAKNKKSVNIKDHLPIETKLLSLTHEIEDSSHFVEDWSFWGAQIH